MSRCHECLDEFAPGADRWAIIKQVLEEAPEVAKLPDVERRALRGMLYGQVYVCEGCAGWHRDAVRVSASEAGEL